MNLRTIIGGTIVGLSTLLASGVAQGKLTSRVNDSQEIVHRQIKDSIDRVVEQSYDGSLISFDNPKTSKPELDTDRLYKDIKHHEGVEKKAYKDSRGYMTIGAGFNLDRGAYSREKISSLGLDFKAVYNGKIELTNTQINTLMKDDVNNAIDDSKKYLGIETWNNIDINAREIVVNIAYNRGYPNLIKFRGVKKALSLNKPNYVRAADELEWENPDAKELIHTKWYNRTGNRAKELVERMRNISEAKK